jgi:hypothetical protein
MEELAMQAWVMGDSASLGIRRKDVSLTVWEDDGDGDDTFCERRPLL